VHLGEAVGAELAHVVVAGRQQQDDAVVLEPPGHEHQRVRRRLVQPLRVADQAEHRPLAGQLGQQAERPKSDEELVGCGCGLGVDQPERSPERGGLGEGQAVDPVQDRPQQLVQGGKGQPDLGLDPRRAEQLEVAGLPGGILQQGVLADAGLTADHEHAAVPLARFSEQVGNTRALLKPSIEHGELPAGSGPAGSGPAAAMELRSISAQPRCFWQALTARQWPANGARAPLGNFAIAAYTSCFNRLRVITRFARCGPLAARPRSSRRC
jgi:hypothetical protein